jgi:hypothetical protein
MQLGKRKAPGILSRRVAVRLISSSVKRPLSLVQIIQHSPFNIEHFYPHPLLTQRSDILYRVMDTSTILQ